MQYVNLVMAGLWLAVALGLYFWKSDEPSADADQVRRYLALVALVMVGYNLVRWSLMHYQRRARRDADDERS